MSQKFAIRVALCAALVAFAVPCVLFAQNAANAIPSRITQAVDEANLTILRGNTHPLAQARFDQGAAPDSLPLQRMLLVLKRSGAQEAALDALLDAQQNSASPNFHQWLAPQQFGQQFGPSDQDIQTITNWLTSHGFTVAGVSNGRTVIEFSGTAGQLRQALHTEIHRYTMNGQDHWANSSDPQIPAALAPVVAGINTLYNFPRQQMHEIVGNFSRSRDTGKFAPVGQQYTIAVGNNEYAAVAPADFAKIYNVPNALNPPAAPATQYNGDGQTIAIVGESDINANDLNAFRTFFGLPTPAKFTQIINGPDPGTNGAETEADLDVQWAGAVAPNAQIDLVLAEPTEVSLGVDLAAQYAVDNNLAPVLNESFGICEFFMGNADNEFYNQLWQQASAEGITVTVSSGDGGSAVCDQNAGTQGPAQYGLTVSGFTSTPYNVSVGGTDFNDTADFGAYWNLQVSDTPTVASALGYVPEMTWNDSCTNQEIFAHFDVTSAEESCNSTSENSDGLVTVGGGSGGASNCTVSNAAAESSCSGGYAKPSWQTGTGVPNDSHRDVPDVSLFASNGFNASFYIICEADSNPGAPTCDPFNVTSDFIGVGGTSASSPAFAGMMALVNQATGSRQGNANYVLYKLAAQSGNTCTSAASPLGTCVFYDIPVGSTIAMPCASGSPDNPTESNSICKPQTQGDAVGVLTGYASSQGYDQATGLGSVNAGNLISKWNSFFTNLKPSTTALTLDSGSAVNITHGQSVSASIAVNGSGAVPTGNVSLISNTASGGQQSVASAPLVNGTATFSTTSLPGGTNYAIFSQYSGDATFAASASSTQSVTVGPEASKVQFAFQLYDPTTYVETNPNATSATFGQPSMLRFNVTSQAGDACPQNSPGNSGCPTGSLTVTDNGNAIDGGIYNLNSQGYAEDQITNLAPGTHQLSATYPGDNSFNASSAAGTITINKATTTVTLTSNGAAWDGGVYLTVNIATGSYATGTGNLPTGTVQILVDGNTPFVSQLNISSSVNSQTGAAQATTSVDFDSMQFSPGQHTFVAQYSGDPNYAAGSSAVLAVTVTTSTSTDVAFSSATQGSPNAVITAQIEEWSSWSQATGSKPAPTGTVQFNLGSANGAPLGGAPVSNSQARLILSAALIPSGSIVYATYSGDSNYNTSVGSATVSSLLLNTTISLTSSSPSAIAGNPIGFTAQMTPASGGPTPTGTITFFSGSPYNTSISDSKPLGATNQATDSMSLWTGTDAVSATYSGDSNYAPSMTVVLENVSPITTATAVVSSNPAAHVGDSVTFTANVVATESGSPAPSGSMFFYANGKALNSGFVTGGQSSLTVQSLPAGSYPITATFGGDAEHASSSGSVSQSVSPGSSSTSLSSSNSSVTEGTIVTFTAQVTQPNSYAPVPTGSVQFTANGKPIALSPLVNGLAQLITGSLPQGSIAVTATYSGDSNYTGSVANFTETVAASASPSFTVSANPTALTIPAPGGSASTTLTLTSQGSLTGSGGFSSSSCGTLAAEEVTCSLTAFTLPANGTAQAMLTFSSTAASHIAPIVRTKPVLPAINAPKAILFALIIVFLAAIFAQLSRQRRWKFVFATTLFAVVMAGVSCGGGGSSSGGGGGGPANPGTPTGAVQPLSISITINGTTQTVPNLKLTVQ